MNAYGVGLGVAYPKVEAEARPTREPRTALRIRFGRFEFDEANARLLCEGKPVCLPPRPFEVLCALARRPGSLLTKNALLDEVWGHRFVSESVLKTVVNKLRIALQDDARNPRVIETVPRRGYRFIAAADSAERDPPANTNVERRLALVPATPLHATRITADRALREIREMLLLLIEQPHERHGTATRIMDCIARAGV